MIFRVDEGVLTFEFFFLILLCYLILRRRVLLSCNLFFTTKGWPLDRFLDMKR